MKNYLKRVTKHDTTSGPDAIKPAVVFCRLRPDLKRKLQEVAQRQKLSINALCNNVLESYLFRHNPSSDKDPSHG